MTARDRILGNIRQALGRIEAGTDVATEGRVASELPTAVTEHMQARARHCQPALQSSASANNLDQILLQRMEDVQISYVRLQTGAEVPAAVEEYLLDNAIAGSLVVSPALADMEWPDGTVCGAAADALQAGQALSSVTPCLCAVAETGSVVTTSSAGTPATNNFLPDNHIVVLYEHQIVNSIDDAWLLQRELADVPRALNFLTGPSRTADIEQALELGAHGPKRMHVLLIASGGSRPAAS